MKNVYAWLMGLVVLMGLVGCSKDDSVGDTDGHSTNGEKLVHFNVVGDWASPTFSRALTADGQSMTDLWVFDYMGGVKVQELHLTPADEAWSAPSLSLKQGSHVVYFVASRGEGAAVSGSVISWSTPRDTFWKNYAINVADSEADTYTVVLERVVTKLKVTLLDVVPASLNSIDISAPLWYFSLDYLTGSAEGGAALTKHISVPVSYVGTSGQLSLTLFGLSDSDEWTTDVTVTAKDADGGTMGSVVLGDARFVRARATNYSGHLMKKQAAMSLSLDDEWQTALEETW